MNEVASFGVTIIVIVLGLFYFLPAFIADIRRTDHRTAISLVNIFFGWTVLGWIAALIWAVVEKPLKPSSSGVVHTVHTFD